MVTELDPGGTAVSNTGKVSACMKVTNQWGNKLLKKSLQKYKSAVCTEGTIYRQDAE